MARLGGSRTLDVTPAFPFSGVPTWHLEPTTSGIAKTLAVRQHPAPGRNSRARRGLGCGMAPRRAVGPGLLEMEMTMASSVETRGTGAGAEPNTKPRETLTVTDNRTG